MTIKRRRLLKRKKASNGHVSILAKIRAHRGLTQIDMAKELGIDQSTISKIESGVRGIPNSLIKKLKKVYNVNSSQLIDELE